MAKTKKVKAKGKGIIAEFKTFISRGNVLDMAVGVVIGGAFSAIVTALVNILLSVCTWPVPGGLAGLVTVLPALSAGQKAPAGYENIYSVSDFLAKGFSATEAGMYVQHGANYYYKGCAIIDWGALINAIISFLIVAVVLFIIVKTVNAARKAADDVKAKAQEAYYEKHPEERPVPPEPGVPEPTDHELLKEMLKVLKEKK